MTSCKHMNFDVNVIVNRLEDTGRFIADVRINCLDCGEPFQFLGLPPGLKMAGAACSVDGLEARLVIHPNSQTMSPMAHMMADVKGKH